MFYDWNWTVAEQEFKHALQLNPNSSRAHLYYSFFLTFTDRHDEAIAEAKQAQKLDPLSNFINTECGLAYFYAGQFDRAIEELQMTIAINPNYFITHFHLGRVYSGKSMFKEAIEEYEKAIDLSGGTPVVLSWPACAYYEIGKKEQAEKLIDSLKQRSKQEYVPPMCFFVYHQTRGDHDQAYKWLERAIDEHDSFLPWWISIPIDTYRIPDEPRFNELMEKVGLERSSNQTF
jgi:tetratricopeptide (TPR) repeat protein